MRYGCCPFNTDCLYLHDQKYARHVCLPVNPTKILLPLHNVVGGAGAGVLFAYTVLTYLLAQQYHTEDDDLAGVDLLNLFIAMTLLGVGDDDEEDDYEDMDFSFYMPGYYGF